MKKSAAAPIAQPIVPGQSVPIAPTPGRSEGPGESAGAAGAAAGAVAVRGRSFSLQLAQGLDLSPRPAGVADAWHRPCASSSAFDLTPARWDARKMARQPLRFAGSGGRVADATGLQRLCNRQSIEIARVFARLQRLQLCASRDVRVRMCVDARACRGGSNSATLQPFGYIYVYQRVMGCTAVAQWLRLQPMAGAGRAACLALLDRDILAGGYRRDVVDRPASSVLLGRVAKSFGVSGWRGGSIELDRELVVQAGRNGGNPPLSRGSMARVGRVALEGLGQGLDLAWQFGAARLPVRLNAGRQGGEAIGAEAPPLPPSRARAAPSMVALETTGILIGHRAEQPLNLRGGWPRLAGARGMSGWADGSGWGILRPGTGPRKPGRGAKAAARVRQNGDDTGRAARVN